MSKKLKQRNFPPLKIGSVFFPKSREAFLHQEKTPVMKQRYGSKGYVKETMQTEQTKQTKRNQTKQSKTNNQTKPNQTKPQQHKTNQTKTKQNKTKQNKQTNKQNS